MELLCGTSTMDEARPGYWKIALLFLLIPVAFYWRHDLFLLWDDWTELDLIAHNSFLTYVTTPNGEIFFPFFHLIFYGLIKILGEHYGILVLINCLATGLVAFLVYLFFKNHMKEKLALVLSFLYAGSAVHQAIVWNAFYLCYVLCLIFFVAALLLIDSYIKKSSYLILLSISLCIWLSIHSHNYTLLALLVLPLYVALVGGAKAWSKALGLAGIVSLVLLSFAWEYLMFAGLKATTFFNHGHPLTFPVSACISHWICGAILSPFYLLFWGHFRFPAVSIIFGALVVSFCVLIIWTMGTPKERRMGLWALMLNAFPFLLVSLGRHTFCFEQAFSERYVFFTMVGALLLVGMTGTILSRRISSGIWRRSLAYLLIALMITGQTLSMPSWQKYYLHLSKKSFDCYQEPELFAKEAIFFINPYYPVGKTQVEDIRRFLKNKAWLTY